MKRIRTKIGDVFAVEVDDSCRKYFQYIANDLSQLNSDVIRVFAKTYAIDSDPELSEVISGEIDFHAHCVVNIGIKLEFWRKIGNITNVGELDDILFRDTNDCGDPSVTISHDWWIWRVNEEQRNVGRLKGRNRDAEIGVVVAPDSIVHRMRTGKYLFVYPAYE